MASRPEHAPRNRLAGMLRGRCREIAASACVVGLAVGVPLVYGL